MVYFENLQRIFAVFFRESNWIRCIACSSDGDRLAVCQLNDYVRVYLCDSMKKAPITLKHPAQKDVTDMAWK